MPVLAAPTLTLGDAAWSMWDAPADRPTIEDDLRLMRSESDELRVFDGHFDATNVTSSMCSSDSNGSEDWANLPLPRIISNMDGVRLRSIVKAKATMPRVPKEQVSEVEMLTNPGNRSPEGRVVSARVRFRERDSVHVVPGLGEGQADETGGASATSADVDEEEEDVSDDAWEKFMSKMKAWQTDVLIDDDDGLKKGSH